MSTINKEQAEDLDLILRHIEYKKGSSVEEINKNLLNNKSYSYCETLITILNSKKPSLIKVIEEAIDTTDNIVFDTTDYISSFLQEGGYTKLYNVEEEKNIREKEKEELSFEKLKDDTKNLKVKHVILLLTFISLLIGIIYKISPSIIEFINAHYNK
jgi:hypothetical protein